MASQTKGSQIGLNQWISRQHAPFQSGPGQHGGSGPRSASLAGNKVRLADVVRDRWGKDVGGLYPLGDQPDNEFLTAADELARQHLPLAVAGHLADIMMSNGPLFRMADNLPIDGCIPPAPTDGKRPAEKATWISEAVLLGATRALGLEVFTYRQERNGLWPQQVAPMRGQESANHSGNTEEFGLHSDNAILAREHRAEFIALLGLSNDANTETSLVPVDDMLTELDRVSTSFVPLMEDDTQWKVPFPESFDVGPDRTLSNPCAILTRGPSGQHEIAMAMYNVQPLTKESRDVIEAIKSILTPPLVRTVVLAPGSILLLNNFRGLHGRGRIAGTRWAQRIYLGRSLEALQTACGTDDGCRVFDVRKLRHK
jgi:L-asparagine oxygenase